MLSQAFPECACRRTEAVGEIPRPARWQGHHVVDGVDGKVREKKPDARAERQIGFQTAEHPPPANDPYGMRCRREEQGDRDRRKRKIGECPAQRVPARAEAAARSRSSRQGRSTTLPTGCRLMCNCPELPATKNRSENRGFFRGSARRSRIRERDAEGCPVCLHAAAPERGPAARGATPGVPYPNATG